MAPKYALPPSGNIYDLFVEGDEVFMWYKPENAGDLIKDIEEHYDHYVEEWKKLGGCVLLPNKNPSNPNGRCNPVPKKSGQTTKCEDGWGNIHKSVWWICRNPGCSKPVALVTRSFMKFTLTDTQWRRFIPPRHACDAVNEVYEYDHGYPVYYPNEWDDREAEAAKAPKVTPGFAS